MLGRVSSAEASIVFGGFNAIVLVDMYVSRFRRKIVGFWRKEGIVQGFAFVNLKQDL